MTSLESLVPSLEVCRQLQALGFPQDTALGWHKHIRVWGDGQFDDEWDWFLCEICPRNSGDFVCAAPTAGEMEEWLRGKVGNPLEETTVITSHDESKEVAYCAGVRSAQGKYQIAYNDTNVSALAALVLEVAG